MQFMQTLEQRIAGEFSHVIPSKQTDLFKSTTQRYEGYYNLRQLDIAINQTFDRFAYDKDFQKQIEKRPEILDIMKRIKKIYHDNIISYEVPVRTFENMHIKELRAILDSRLVADDFYERLKELEKNLSGLGRTMISDELRYSFLIEQKKKKREEELRIYKALKDEAGKKKNEIRKAPKTSINNSGNPFYQKVLDFIRATPDLSLCVQNPESSKYIPYIKSIIGDESGIDEKLTELFKNNSGEDYRNFMFRIKNKLSAGNSIIQNIMNGQARKSGKESGKFELADINPASWMWLSSYYSIETPVKNFVLNFRKNYADSLVGMIEKAYDELMRTPGIQN